LKGAEVPPGFSLIKFAALYRPTAFAFDRNGRMYVTSQDGNAYVLRDADKDGHAHSRSTFATGYYFPVDVAVHIPTGDVYVSYQGAISVLSDMDGDQRSDKEKILVDDLPAGKHQNDNLKFGPDSKLYIGVGSACDACEDSDLAVQPSIVLMLPLAKAKLLQLGCVTHMILLFTPSQAIYSPWITAVMIWVWMLLLRSSITLFKVGIMGIQVAGMNRIRRIVKIPFRQSLFSRLIPLQMGWIFTMAKPSQPNIEAMLSFRSSVRG
jgi:hypothetical protein